VGNRQSAAASGFSLPFLPLLPLLPLLLPLTLPFCFGCKITNVK